MGQAEEPSGPPPTTAAARLEEVIERFEDAWQRGERPAIDDHLVGAGADRAALLAELVHVDLECRLKHGEPARVEEYLGRYPELVRDRRVVLELLAAEWKLRRRDDPSIGAEEYARRFPDFRDDLVQTITIAGGAAGSAWVPPPPTPDHTQRADEPEAAAATGAATGEATTRSRYRILRLHARGGLGEILTARDEDLRREVALKRLQPRLAHGAESRERFLREAEVTSQLEHPGVVPVYGLGQAADGSPIYAMRFIRGETFQEAADRFHGAEKPGRAAAERRLAFRQLLTRFVSVCNTIAYAHSRGVLHRDIKPGNILLGSYGETLVVDWGLAKPAYAAGPASPPIADAPTLAPDSDLTQTGEVFGTPAYMSPEQADGQWDAVGPASDVYSLGATLYVLLTGRPPFGPGTVGQVLEGVRRGTFPRPRQVNKRVGKALEAVCLKAMAARPEERYATPLALAADLEKWLAGEAVVARRESAGERVGRWMRRRVTFVTTAAVLLVAGAAVAVVTALWFAAADREKSAKTIADVRQKELDRADRERYYSHVRDANREWWFGRFDEAARLLKECDRPELRGWEWNYLTRRTGEADSRQTLIGHDKEVWNVAYSRDGASLASASLDGTVRVWDAADGRLRFILGDHDKPVYAVAFSPDGTQLASGGADQAVRLWDVKTGQALRAFDGLNGGVFGVAFSRNGKLLAAAVGGPGVSRVHTAGVAGEVDLWDYPAGVKHEPLAMPASSPTGVAFAPNDRIVLAGTLNGTVERWDVVAGKELEPLAGPQRAVQSVAVSPDGRWVAATGGDGVVWLWDARTGMVKRQMYGHTAYAWGVAFSPDSRTLASSADDHTVRVWDPETGAPLFALHGHAAGIANVVFSPDGASLASASDDKTVKIWDARGLKSSRAFSGHKHPVYGVAVGADGRRIASAGADAPDGGPTDDAAVRVWDADGAEVIGLRVAGGAFAVAFGSDGRLLAAAGGDGTVRVWDVEAGWQEHLLKGHADKVLAVAFRPDGRVLASASADGTVKLWDAATWSEVRTLRGSGEPMRATAFSPDGKRVAAGGDDKTVHVWNATTGEEEMTLPHRAVVCGVAFSPDGKRLASVTAGSAKVFTRDAGEITVWELETRQAVQTLRGHVGDVLTVAYSPDGKRLVSAGWDGNMKLWEPATGQEIVTLYAAHADSINAVAFSPDGGRLVSASGDGSLVVWDGSPADEAASK